MSTGRERRVASFSDGDRESGTLRTERSSSNCSWAKARDLGCRPGPFDHMIALLTMALSSGW